MTNPDPPRDPNDDGLSFDPRTWGRDPASPPQSPAAPPPPPAAAPDNPPAPAVAAPQGEPGLDVRNWLKAAPEPASEPDPAPVEAPAAPPPRRMRPADPGLDVKAWMAPEQPAPAEAEPPAPVAKRAGAPVALIGGLVGLLAIGAVAFAVLRPAPPAPAPTPAPKAAAAAPAAPAAPEPVVGPSTEARTLTLRGPQELAKALADAGLAPDTAAAAASSARAALEGSGELTVEMLLAPGATTRLINLTARTPQGSGVTLAVNPDGTIAARKLAADIRTEYNVVRGEMDADSFYTSAVAAGVPDYLINDFAAALSFDFDFQREIKTGDIFEVVFETKAGARDVEGVGRLLYVSLTTATKAKELYKVKFPSDEEARWFDGTGTSTKKLLMRTPLNGARLTSPFGPRLHPVLGYTRIHAGQDFGAPIGTPIFASGDGVVMITNRQSRGYGYYLVIQHNDEWSTAYAHMQDFAEGIAPGVRVRQGQVVAFVGNRGVGTGPHLHYEVIHKGAKVDPMGIEVPAGEGKGMSPEDKAIFMAERDRIDRIRALGRDGTVVAEADVAP
jgi:murein DD-endopeptidase MepM/ murein hydrolase activator NlpD